jgi:hypothetical protein
MDQPYLFEESSEWVITKTFVFQKGVWYSGTKIYNHLPPALKQLSYNISKFKTALKIFLLTNSFYTLEAGNKDLGS